MARFYKQPFNRDGRPLQRKIVFIGQHEIEINSGSVPLGDEVEIEVEGENTCMILALSREEAQKVRRYLHQMGY